MNNDLRKPWQTKEWIQKRKEYLKGKNCEWCGSTENLSISHKEMDNRRDIKYQVIGEFTRNYLHDEKNKDEINELKDKAREGVRLEYMDACPTCKKSCYSRKTVTPKFRCLRCEREFDEAIKILKLSTVQYLNKHLYLEIRNKYSKEIEKIISDKTKQSDERYHSFANVMVQCKRCHFAFHKGMDLCPKCKKKYKKTRYGTCWDCLPKDFRKGYEEKKGIKIYVHPWCKEEIGIEAQWWDIEAEPRMACIERCPKSLDVYSCELSKNNWGNFENN